MTPDAYAVVTKHKPPEDPHPGKDEQVVVCTRSGEMFKGSLKTEGSAVVVMNDKEWVVIGIDEIVYVTVPPPKVELNPQSGA